MANKRGNFKRLWSFTFTVASAGTPVTVTTQANKRFLVVGWGVTVAGSPYQFFDTAGVFQVGSIKIDASASSCAGTAYCIEVDD